MHGYKRTPFTLRFQKGLVTKGSWAQLMNVEAFVYHLNTDKYTKDWRETFVSVGIILACLESFFPLRSKHLFLPGMADWHQTGRIQRAMNHNRVCISRLLVHAAGDQQHPASTPKPALLTHLLMGLAPRVAVCGSIYL